MYASNYHSSDYYASLYYSVLRDDGEEPDLSAFENLAVRDIRYEALKLVSTPDTDAHDMERQHWIGLFGGTGTSNDVKHAGIIVGLGFTSLKDYYDNITGTIWPDVATSEKAYWLKIIADNL